MSLKLLKGKFYPITKKNVQRNMLVNFLTETEKSKIVQE